MRIKQARRIPNRELHFTDDYYKTYLTEVDPYVGSVLLSEFKSTDSNGNISKVLDLGCGSGAYLTFLRQNRIETYGLDEALPALNISKQIRACATHLPFKDSSFDGVLSVHTVEHLTHVETMFCFHEINRILKPGGKVFIMTPNLLSFPSRLLRGKRWFYDPTHINLFNPFGLKKLLEIHGFGNIRFRFPLSTTPRVINKWVMPYFGQQRFFRMFPKFQDVVFMLATSSYLAYIRPVLSACATKIRGS